MGPIRAALKDPFSHLIRPQMPWPSMALVIRTALPNDRINTIVCDAVHALDATLPVPTAHLMEPVVWDAAGQPRFRVARRSVRGYRPAAGDESLRHARLQRISARASVVVSNLSNTLESAGNDSPACVTAASFSGPSQRTFLRCCRATPVALDL
jgi:hypothetical protein